MLDAAVEWLWRQGTVGFDLAIAASVTGLTPAVLVDEFVDAEGLEAAAFDHYEQRMVDAVFGPLIAGIGHPRAVPRFLDDIAAWVTQPGKSGCMILNEGNRAGATSAQHRRRGDAYRQRMRTMLIDAMAVHSLDEAQAQRRADVVLVGVIGLSSILHSGGDDMDVLALLVSLQTQVSEWVGA
ncbi:MAG: hypothetical protein AAF548_12965 [Actinomycetota bacterium]